MLRYISLIAPILLRKKTSRSIRAMSGYMGAIFLTGVAIIFFLAALFTWTRNSYGLDVALAVIGLVLLFMALCLSILGRQSFKKSPIVRNGEAPLLAAQDDPVAAFLPDEAFENPAIQKLLLQINEKPFASSATAVGLGVLLSRQLIDAND